MKTAPDFQERRRRRRFWGEIPLEIKQGKGKTRDFSYLGVFFETDQCLTPGEKVEFALSLEHLEPGQPVHLRCQGDVLRVERLGELLGVAVAIHSFSFEAPGARRFDALNKR